MLHELLYKDFSDIVGDAFPLLGSPSLPAGETAHEAPERVNRAAAKGYSLKCWGSAVEWTRGSSRRRWREGGGGGGEGERGFQAGATLDHDASALQVDCWSGSGGKRRRGSPKRWRGWQERIHSLASACRARGASDRSSGGGGGGGAALSPPPEGSTDNKSWAEKR